MKRSFSGVAVGVYVVGALVAIYVIGGAVLWFDATYAGSRFGQALPWPLGKFVVAIYRPTFEFLWKIGWL